jgi:hypothetical protein
MASQEEPDKPFHPSRVVYARRLKRVTLTRYLCTKLVYSLHRVTFEDVLTLYDNQIWLEEKANKDQGFRQKFGGSLEELSLILKDSPFRGNLDHYLTQVSQKVRNKLEGFYLPQRNLSGVEHHVKGLYSVEMSRSLGIDVKRLPPKGYIGKGYSDKGARRDPAYDGSPHWSEVAIHFERKES